MNRPAQELRQDEDTPVSTTGLSVVDAPDAPGVYPGIPDELYHQGPGISSSQLKFLAAKTPAHYYAKYLDPQRETPQTKPTLDLGKAFHCRILEPHRFVNDFAFQIDPREYPNALVTMDDLRRQASLWDVKLPRLKSEAEAALAAAAEARGEPIVIWSHLLADFERRNAGRIVLPLEMEDQLIAMQQALFAHRTASRAFHSGVAEASVYWEDPDSGLLLKCRPDYWRHTQMLTDLKSTRSASKWAFSKDIFEYGYHVSAAMYLDGIKHETGEDMEDRFLWVAQEKEPPYAVNTFVPTPESIAEGRRVYKAAALQLAECLATNVWPGYPEEVEMIDLPAYAYRT